MKKKRKKLRKKPQTNRFLSLAVAVCFLATNLNLPAASAKTGEMAAAPTFSMPQDPSELNLPAEIGKIEKTFQGTSPQTVILVRDAHSIPEAQEHIREIITHFQKNYGFHWVGAEGAAGKLDAQIFQSFPDKKRLAGVFEEYLRKGELTGVNAAALFDAGAGLYEGLEDWDLYIEGLQLYRGAIARRPDLEKELEEIKKKQTLEKQRFYSGKLFEIDQALEAFQENLQDLPGVLKKLSSVKRPEAKSELALLLVESERGGKDPASLNAEVRRIAEQAAASVKGTPQAVDFNQKHQEFLTSRISAGEFGLYLQHVIARTAKPAEAISKSLQQLSADHKRLKQIEGSKLFDDFENYARAVKESLFQNSEERRLDRESRRLRLLKKLIRLELSREEWEELKPLREALPDKAEHFSFYQNTEKRDEVLFRNLKKRAGKGSALLVAGGFHTEALAARLKSEGISFAVVRPAIGLIPEDDFYGDQMRGDFSWKDYFEPENGKINVRKAFTRAARDRLLGASSPNDTSAGPLLKSWRDQLIRDLAQQNRIDEAPEYLSLIDETGKKAIQAKTSQLKKEWLHSVDEFISRFRSLESQGKLSEQNILEILKPSATPSLIAAVFNNAVQIPAEFFTVSRSELRVQEEIMFQGKWYGMSVHADDAKNAARDPGGVYSFLKEQGLFSGAIPIDEPAVYKISETARREVLKLQGSPLHLVFDGKYLDNCCTQVFNSVLDVAIQQPERKINLHLPLELLAYENYFGRDSRVEDKLDFVLRRLPMDLSGKKVPYALYVDGSPFPIEEALPGIPSVKIWIWQSAEEMKKQVRESRSEVRETIQRQAQMHESKRPDVEYFEREIADPLRLPDATRRELIQIMLGSKVPYSEIAVGVLAHLASLPELPGRLRAREVLWAIRELANVPGLSRVLNHINIGSKENQVGFYTEIVFAYKKQQEGYVVLSLDTDLPPNVEVDILLFRPERLGKPGMILAEAKYFPDHRNLQEWMKEELPKKIEKYAQAVQETIQAGLLLLEDYPDSQDLEPPHEFIFLISDSVRNAQEINDGRIVPERLEEKIREMYQALPESSAGGSIQILPVTGIQEAQDPKFRKSFFIPRSGFKNALRELRAKAMKKRKQARRKGIQPQKEVLPASLLPAARFMRDMMEVYGGHKDFPLEQAAVEKINVGDPKIRQAYENLSAILRQFVSTPAARTWLSELVLKAKPLDPQSAKLKLREWLENKALQEVERAGVWEKDFLNFSIRSEIRKLQAEERVQPTTVPWSLFEREFRGIQQKALDFMGRKEADLPQLEYFRREIVDAATTRYFLVFQDRRSFVFTTRKAAGGAVLFRKEEGGQTLQQWDADKASDEDLTALIVEVGRSLGALHRGDGKINQAFHLTGVNTPYTLNLEKILWTVGQNKSFHVWFDLSGEPVYSNQRPFRKEDEKLEEGLVSFYSNRLRPDQIRRAFRNGYERVFVSDATGPQGNRWQVSHEIPVPTKRELEGNQKIELKLKFMMEDWEKAKEEILSYYPGAELVREYIKPGSEYREASFLIPARFALAGMILNAVGLPKNEGGEPSEAEWQIGVRLGYGRGKVEEYPYALNPRDIRRFIKERILENSFKNPGSDDPQTLEEVENHWQLRDALDMLNDRLPGFFVPKNILEMAEIRLPLSREAMQQNDLWMDFEEYMDRSNRNYYAGHVKFGPDFITPSTEESEDVGEGLAEYAFKQWQLGGRPALYRVGEIGGGEGHIATAFLKFIAEKSRASDEWKKFAQALEFVHLDRSGDLLAKQTARIAKALEEFPGVIRPIRGFPLEASRPDKLFEKAPGFLFNSELLDDLARQRIRVFPDGRVRKIYPIPAVDIDGWETAPLFDPEFIAHIRSQDQRIRRFLSIPEGKSPKGFFLDPESYQKFREKTGNGISFIEGEFDITEELDRHPGIQRYLTRNRDRIETDFERHGTPSLFAYPSLQLENFYSWIAGSFQDSLTLDYTEDDEDVLNPSSQVLRVYPKVKKYAEKEKIYDDVYQAEVVRNITGDVDFEDAQRLAREYDFETVSYGPARDFFEKLLGRKLQHDSLLVRDSKFRVLVQSTRSEVRTGKRLTEKEDFELSERLKIEELFANYMTRTLALGLQVPNRKSDELVLSGNGKRSILVYSPDKRKMVPAAILDADPWIKDFLAERDIAEIRIRFGPLVYSLAQKEMEEKGSAGGSKILREAFNRVESLLHKFISDLSAGASRDDLKRFYIDGVPHPLSDESYGVRSIKRSGKAPSYHYQLVLSRPSDLLPSFAYVLSKELHAVLQRYLQLRPQKSGRFFDAARYKIKLDDEGRLQIRDLEEPAASITTSSGSVGSSPRVFSAVLKNYKIASISLRFLNDFEILLTGKNNQPATEEDLLQIILKVFADHAKPPMIRVAGEEFHEADMEVTQSRQKRTEKVPEEKGPDGEVQYRDVSRNVLAYEVTLSDFPGRSELRRLPGDALPGEFVERWRYDGNEFEIRTGKAYKGTPGFDIYWAVKNEKGKTEFQQALYYAFDSGTGTIHQFVKDPGAPAKIALGVFDKIARGLKERGMKLTLFGVIGPKMVSLLKRVGTNLEMEISFGPLSSWDENTPKFAEAEAILGQETARELTVSNKYGIAVGQVRLQRGGGKSLYSLIPLSEGWTEEAGVLSYREIRLSLEDGKVSVREENWNDDAPGAGISYYLPVEKPNSHFPYLQDYLWVNPLTGRRSYAVYNAFDQGSFMKKVVDLIRTPEGLFFAGDLQYLQNDRKEIVVEFPPKNNPVRQRLFFNERGNLEMENISGQSAGQSVDVSQYFFYDINSGGSFTLRADPVPLSSSKSEFRKAVPNEVFVNLALELSPFGSKTPRSELRRAVREIANGDVSSEELREILEGAVEKTILEMSIRSEAKAVRKKAVRAIVLADVKKELYATLGTQESPFAVGAVVSSKDSGLSRAVIQSLGPGATVIWKGPLPDPKEIAGRGAQLRTENMAHRIELKNEQQPEVPVVLSEGLSQTLHEMFRPFYLEAGELDPELRADAEDLGETILSVAAVHYARIVTEYPEHLLHPELLKAELIRRLQLFEKFPDIFSVRSSGSRWGFGLLGSKVQEFFNSKLAAASA